MSCKIIYKDNERVGVEDDNGQPSKLFQEILSNPQIKDFSEALEVYKQTKSDEITFPKAKVQSSGFYSNAEQALLNLKDKNTKNVKGWISQLTDTQKNGGIKNVNQELEWIGLEDYLSEYVKENNPKAGNIPSSVVEDYIKSNQIEIVDVSKMSNDNRGKYNQLVELQTQAVDEGNYDIAEGYRVQIEQMEDEGTVDNTKYSGYQLKGGENYREVLLTMPEKQRINGKYEVRPYKDNFSIWNNDTNRFEDIVGEVSFEEANTRLNRMDSLPYLVDERSYKSSHWDEANILAHVRLNEKTLPDGRRVMIVNEIQADISQDLKKEQDKILDRVDKEFDNFLDNLIMNKVIIEEC